MMPGPLQEGRCPTRSLVANSRSGNMIEISVHNPVELLA